MKTPGTKILMTGAVAMAAVFATAEASAKDVSFKDDVMPILKQHCLECHVPGEPGHKASGLDMTSYEGLMKGTMHGRIIEPGNGTLSNLIRLIEGQAAQEVRMPHNKPMISKDARNVIRRWINQGAQNN